MPRMQWSGTWYRYVSALVIGIGFLAVGGTHESPAYADELLSHAKWTAVSDTELTYSTTYAYPPVAITLPDRPGTLSIRLAARERGTAGPLGGPADGPRPGMLIEASVPVTAGNALHPGLDLVMNSVSLVVTLGPDAEGAPIWLAVEDGGQNAVEERVFPGVKARQGSWAGPAVTLVYRIAGPAHLTAPKGVDFGAHAVRSGWRWLPVRIENTGGLPLVVRDFKLPTGDFTLHDPGTTCRRGATLAPGSGCDVAVMFRPGSAGARAASLTVLGDGLLVVPLTGTGTGTGGDGGGPSPVPPPPAGTASTSAAPGGSAAGSDPPTSVEPPAVGADRPARNRAAGGMSASEFLLEWALPMGIGLAVGLYIRRRLRLRRARS
ncbi:hypothetical protein [Embleya sp. AB8]|uniref:hypothetical protein n=1 Tax=Embleya sp. AB8 TaxID=3156304 RepID=UPI003C72D682